jgi:hypothetical protein
MRQLYPALTQLELLTQLWGPATGRLNRNRLAPRPPFRDAAAETGLRFQHFNGAAGKYYLPEIMGPGVALVDYDGDGDLDVYFVQGARLEPGRTAETPVVDFSAVWSTCVALSRNQTLELWASAPQHFQQRHSFRRDCRFQRGFTVRRPQGRMQPWQDRARLLRGGKLGWINRPHE